MRILLSILLAMVCCCADGAAQGPQPLLVGSKPASIVSTSIVSVAACSGSNSCSFQPGTTNGIGTAMAQLSNGANFAGAWTMVTAGTATNPPGTSCPDNSAFFSLSAAGVLASTPSSANVNYTICIAASQAGLVAPNPYIQVVTLAPSGSVSCDIGPPYSGAIPAAATQAGMTHCVANYDFTYTGGSPAGTWTDVNGTHTWSNVFSWLNCGFFSVGNPYLFYWIGDGTPCDSAHFYITTDQGTQVLALAYTVADNQAGHYNPRIASEISTSSVPGNPLPQEFYVEFTLRLDDITNNCNPCHNPLFDISTYTSVSGNPCFTARDQEFNNGQTATGIGLAPWNYNGCTGGSSGTGSGPTTNSDGPYGPSYGTFGGLVTGDGVSKYGACDYWASGAVRGLPSSAFGSCLTNSNGTPGTCCSGNTWTMVPPATTAIFNNRIYQYIVEGPQGAGSTWTRTSTTYIQRMTTWACSGYASGPCINNPVITTAPP